MGKTYSAAYWISNAAGKPEHDFGALPPAVSTRYTSWRLPVAPLLACSLSQATAPSPCWPVGAVPGASVVPVLLQGMVPRAARDVSSVKNGVVALVKKWCPEMPRLVGPSFCSQSEPEPSCSCSVDDRLKCSASFGSWCSRSGYDDATQLALKSVATAPAATGSAVAFVTSHV